MVLGSGWSAAADDLGEHGRRAAPWPTCPASRAPAVPGTAAPCGSSAPRPARSPRIFTGRTHFYEGRGVDAVVHGVRTAAAAGAELVVLTNGCGGLNRDWTPGTPVLINDHINLTGATPAARGDVHRPDRGLLRSAARARPRGRPRAARGRLRPVPRARRTRRPAEVRMAGVLGGDLVGMSTALETIAAREAGLEVLGISLVTNLAAGISPTRSATRRCSRPGGRPPRSCAALLAGLAAAPVSIRGSVERGEQLRPLAVGQRWSAQDPDPRHPRRAGQTCSTRSRPGASESRRRADRRLRRTAGVRHRRAARRARRRTRTG